jgi:hypothetical protein
MNFDETKKKYPKAWEKFVAYSFDGSDNRYWILTDEMKGNVSFLELIGYLFKFFDEQKLIVMVTLSGRWYWRICSLEIPTVWSNLKTPGLDNRQEAEQAAFTKAFKILEGK